MSQSITQWKSEQREILRESFAPAFVKYTELVNKIHEPDDWRKYLEFIAKQVGLEEPSSKSSPNDGFAMVNINIGSFRRTAMPVALAAGEGIRAAPMNFVATAAATMLTPEDVEALPVSDPAPEPVPTVVQDAVADGGFIRSEDGIMPMFDPKMATLLASDVLEPEPAEAVDFETALDSLLA